MLSICLKIKIKIVNLSRGTNYVLKISLLRSVDQAVRNEGRKLI